MMNTLSYASADETKILSNLCPLTQVHPHVASSVLLIPNHLTFPHPETW